MRVRFEGLLPAAGEKGSLAPESEVATFDVEGRRVPVLARDVSPFRDIQIATAVPHVRGRLVLALCRHVRNAELTEGGTLGLASRFRVSPDQDEPRWTQLGFTSVQTVDFKVIKHVLGFGVPGSSEAGWWASRLGLPTSATSVLAELERQGCTGWKALARESDPDVNRPVSLYWDLSNSRRAACIEVLAELRERYLEVVTETVRSTANLQRARHAHLGIGAASAMHFLDQDGVVVIAKGSPEGLSAATGFVALTSGEERLGPATLRKRWNKLVQEVLTKDLRTVKFHSPVSWKQA